MPDDARAIENLILSYAECVDAGDLEAVASILADATIGLEGMPDGLRGREKILGLLRSTIRLHEDGTPKTKHVTTNILVEVDETAGTATARSYFTVLQAAAGLGLQAIVAGRYRDRFARGDGGWRFTERRFQTDLVGDVSRHLLAGPEILGGG
ncbi:MAG TPA: nuclear transport factor 2 family protein [Acidimicrobiales bacterium]|nr:nuclear transport factor 2 family protein [Acidimicrobiales bacterium]